MNMIKIENFKDAKLFTLQNSDLKVQITNYGARIVSIIFNDVDVVLGYDNLDDYIKDTDTYFGATIGRCANRIENGYFKLNNKEYQLNINNGLNSLHGGIEGFDRKYFDYKIKQNKLYLHYLSKDGEENYPGDLDLTVIYSLKRNQLNVEYIAHSNQLTLCNLTNHTYFNLNGEGNNDILNHKLKINADYYTPINKNLIPLGYKESVNNTPFDFRNARFVKRSIKSRNEQIKIAKGLDHNFCLNKDNSNLTFVASLNSKQTNITLKLYTSLPGLQVYSSNFVNVNNGKIHHKYGKHSAICLEPQYYPNAINNDFESPIIDEKHPYHHYISYRFYR